ncbi:hypothetical protein protein [Bacillus cereus G9241]|nr:hypothetical protein protein [Bacillus cereus G9241]
MPPAQPHTEFTITSVVPFLLNASSTASGVVNSVYPAETISSRAWRTTSFIKKLKLINLFPPLKLPICILPVNVYEIQVSLLVFEHRKGVRAGL